LFDLLNYLYGVMKLYEMTANETLLSIAKDLWNYIYNNFRDSTYGGLMAFWDFGDYVKSSTWQSVYAVDSFMLYQLTNNVTYRDYISECIRTLEKMWDNGFHNSYDPDFVIRNSNRFSTEITIFGPLAGYSLGVLLTGNTTYSDRILTLLYQENEYFWDQNYGGYYYVLDPSFNVYDDRKNLHIHGFDLLLYSMLITICDFELHATLQEHINYIVEKLCEKINLTAVIPKMFYRDWSPTTTAADVGATLAVLSGLISYRSMGIDGEPPIISNVNLEEKDSKILVTANVTDNTAVDTVILSYTTNTTSCWYNTTMTLIEEIYQAEIHRPAQPTIFVVKIFACDIYGNWAVSEEYQFEIGGIETQQTSTVYPTLFIGVGVAIGFVIGIVIALIFLKRKKSLE